MITSLCLSVTFCLCLCVSLYLSVTLSPVYFPLYIRQNLIKKTFGLYQPEFPGLDIVRKEAH